MMTALQFLRWRRRMKLTQVQAAEKLGVRRRSIQYYEAGKRNGRPFPIPRVVELATKAIEANL